MARHWIRPGICAGWSILILRYGCGRLTTCGAPFAAAFPAPPSAGARLPEAQRRYLRALADNDTLWNTKIANGKLYLQRLGLPGDRYGIRRLAG